MHEKYISSYPLGLFIAMLVLCKVYRVSYLYVLGFGANLVANCGLKLFFRRVMGSAGNRPVPYETHNAIQTAVCSAVHGAIRSANAYGFPSGHAQTVGYFVAFAHRVLPWRAWHPAWVVAALLAAAWLMWTRIAFQRHTPVQVLFGFTFGVAVFQSVQWLLTA
jgi:membrane-associated phospholipid phosphatase